MDEPSAALSEAEMYHARKDYEKELAAYQKAKEMKPEEAFPQIKIRELNEFLKKYESYNNFVSQADDLYIGQQFAEARVYYEKALEVLPGESYPKEIISKINIALAEQSEKNKAAYEEAIAKADELYNAEDYDAAMLAYSEALRFWPDGAHAKERIGSIAEIRALQKAQEEAYNNTISLADKLFANKEYPNARDQYLKATEIKPFEQYPKVRMNEIDMILAELQDKLDQYDNIIQGADKLFNVGDYEEARIQYLKAQEILSERKYPADQIRMIDEILGLQVATREEYLAAIARADEHFTNREWEEAKVDYVTANDLIPEEQYPDDKIAEINNILAMLKAEQDTYKLAIKNADQLFADKDYQAALLEYRKAADIFREEEYPRTKIEEINTILAAAEQQKQLDEQYAGAIQDADQLMGSEQYSLAKATYEKAVSLKPDEQYPKDKITEIAGIMKELEQAQALEESFASAMEEGNKLFGEAKYSDARTEFRHALELKPGEQAVADRIAEIDRILAEQQQQAEIDASYASRISEADALFAAANYAEARSAYLDASAIKPSEDYPPAKIKEIDGILTARAAEAERLAELEASYAKAIEDADKLLAAQDFVASRKKYVEAQSLKPSQAYPQQKIGEIDSILAEAEAQMLLDANYSETITAADALLKQEKYTEARVEYARASEMKPGEQYPKDKINEIEVILKEIERLRRIDESYAAAFDAGNNYFAERKYDEARAQYQRALEIKPEEKTPADKISEIEAILAELERQQAAMDAYQTEIANADKLLAGKDYQAAIASYRKALEIKPDETYPEEKITEAENAIRAIQQRDEQYAASIQLADQLLAEEKYVDARLNYSKALELKPEETYPSEKIAEVDAALDKLEVQRKLDEDYASVLKSGDDLFASGKYTEARTEYQKAGSLKPAEEYPRTKITEIDSIIAAQQRQAEIDGSYASAIANADKLLGDKRYQEAIDGYKEASIIKPEETYPAQKISEAEVAISEMERLAELQRQYHQTIETADNYFNLQQYNESRVEYTKALELVPDEAYPASRITEIDNILAGLEQQRLTNEAYASAIASGDRLLTEKNYEQARASFAKALELKPGEEYPNSKIAEIDALVNEIARLQALEEAFAASIGLADNLLASKQYEEARAAYEQALESKPSDAYATGKIAEIDSILAEKRAIQRKYDRAIAAGDSLFGLKSFDDARRSYYLALETLPSKKDYPEQKIVEIDAAIAEIARLKAIDDKYRLVIASADAALERHDYLEALQAYEEASGIKPDEAYPKEKMGEINSRLSELAEERQKAYDAAIVQADNYFDLGNYRKAKSSYETAVNIKPDEQYARQRLDEATKLYAAQVEALKADYLKYVADGDNYFKDKIYDGAIENYRLAAALLPEEEYPSKMINRITQIINDNAITDVNRLAQVIPNNTERKFPFATLPVSVRKENYILLKARNVSGNEFKMLVNFGQDNSKNGGVVLQVPAGTDARDYIIRIGAYYKWFSDDNNWLSIYPEGGDIEVTLVRVSKSD